MSRIAILLLLLLPCFTMAQSVGSREYSMMLSGLLDHSVNEIGVSDLDSTQNVVYLDARELKEFQVSHLKGAIWVGYDNFQKDSIAQIQKNQKIVVYCSVGYRSEKISERLIKMGYKDVSNLYGGLFECVNQGYPIVNDSGKTQEIHAYDKNWGKWLIQGVKVY